MKIVICGSSTFREKMLEYRDRLKDLGHEPVVHHHYEAYVAGTDEAIKEIVRRVKSGEHAAVKKEQGYIKWYHQAILNSDAILVLNFDKNGIKNYIGGNTLMEIGFAHVNDKKVFLLNPIPGEVSYVDEIEAMVDNILEDNLNNII